MMKEKKRTSRLFILLPPIWVLLEEGYGKHFILNVRFLITCFPLALGHVVWIYNGKKFDWEPDDTDFF